MSWDPWESGVLVAITSDLMWTTFEASRYGLSVQEVEAYVSRQETRMILLERELKTIDALDFTRSVLDDVEAL